MSKILILLNEAPYGSERSYNGLRLAGSLARREGEIVRLFLMGDAVACAKRGQKVPAGYYNVGDMVRAVASRKGEVGVCGSCIDARGIGEADLLDGASRSTMDQLTDWTLWADRMIVF